MVCVCPEALALALMAEAHGKEAEADCLRMACIVDILLSMVCNCKTSPTSLLGHPVTWENVMLPLLLCLTFPLHGPYFTGPGASRRKAPPVLVVDKANISIRH
uniref:Uncharacterized protein LOC105134874 n=1 Tax=Rhizophora mucronata TaxID=61149 RepID=A0A2P2NQ57_RHIMU